MGAIIGLDFGTTNSILSYMDGKDIVSYKFGGSEGTNYIPSFLTVDDGHIDIGIQAKENAADNNGIVIYARFKMMLAQSNMKTLEKHGYTKDMMTPSQVSKEYIKKLIAIYQEEQRVEKIENLVITIPEVWQNDNMAARTELKKILQELNLPLKKLVSEPVAAGAYFLHKYKQKKSEEFNGHFLIFDYGGGTLDVTLLESNQQRIKILERTGKGHSDNHLGNAGVAYDNHVIKSIYKNTYGKELTPENKNYYPLLIEFETKKIRQKDKIERSLEKYRKRGNNSSIFSVSVGNETLEITPKMLIECFDEILKEDVIYSLNEIKKHFEYYEVDQENPKKFKIVLVGGFSSFDLSKKIVMDFFGALTISDSKFEQELTKEDTSLAISKGATLISADMIGIDETYPMSIGLVAHRINNEGYKEEFNDVVFKKGEKAVLNDVKFSNSTFSTTGKPSLFFDNGTKNYKIQLDHSIDKIFPNFKDESNSWKIGFSVDQNYFFYMHVVDKTKQETKQELGNLIEEFKNTLIAS